MRIARRRCRALKARCEGEPTQVSVCHCLECQRRKGSVFGVQARFPMLCVTTDGEFRTYERVGESGLWARYHFCPGCGATVFYENEDLPGAYAIPVGAFADPTFAHPTRSIFESRKHQWVQILEGNIEAKP